MFQLKKANYGTKQLEAARRCRTKISSWMEENGYPPVNSEKIIFMKRTSEDFIIHGLLKFSFTSLNPNLNPKP